MPVQEWLARQPESAWRKVTRRPGSKGPLEVEALLRRVQTRDAHRHVGPEEQLLVVRSVVEGQPKIDYSLSNARPEVTLAELVRAHGPRYRIEQMLEEGQGEAGLGHYAVRSWVGWHHHVTLALLALWFLVLEKGRVGKKSCPAVTVPQVREIFTRLLRDPPPRPGEIARQVSAVLRRNEEDRIYSWHQRTSGYPPPRPPAETG